MKAACISSAEARPHLPDHKCTVTAVIIPFRFVIGPVVYKMVIGLVGLMRLAHCVIVRENPLVKIKAHPNGITMLVWYGSVLINQTIDGRVLHQIGHDVAFVRTLLLPHNGI